MWVALLAPLALIAASGPDAVVASLHGAAAEYYAQVGAVAAYTSRYNTMDYYQRLLDDQDLVTATPPPGYDAAAFADATTTIAALDVSLARQLMARAPAPMASIRGLGETLVRSSLDGTMQPVAVYVPSTYVPGTPMALAVFLHGHQQAESALLAPPFMRALAEENRVILVAPYGRGDYDYRGSSQDVYDALNAAKAAFSIDSRKQFLAGYSMGGFCVFEIAPLHPNEWAAVMCIAGALLGHDAPKVVGFMRNVPFYVLTGSADDSIPTQYPTVTASYLSAQGMAVSFYSQPGGLHRLATLDPILRQAWADMLHQIVRSPPPALGSIALPAQAPSTFLKT